MKTMRVPEPPNVRGPREERDWSLDELSFYTGVPVRRLSIIERGLARNIREDEKERIAQALGLTIEEAFA